MSALQKCMEREVKDGKVTGIRALVVLRGTEYWRPALRRWEALIKSGAVDAGEQLVKLAVEVCSTPEAERATLFTDEELADLAAI